MRDLIKNKNANIIETTEDVKKFYNYNSFLMKIITVNKPYVSL